MLKRTLAENRLPNAWIFSGIKGIGKRHVAKILAMAICCNEQNAPCGECTSCKKIEGGIHPDVYVVEPEKQNILAEQIRVLNQKVRLHSLESKSKVVIIDDADMMTETAANSLLKTLEEPPSATHFILITTALHRILPTIRSRCQKIAFSPLSDMEIISFLKKVDDLQDEDASRAAKLSLGSLSLARELTPDFIEEVLGRFEALSKRGSAADIISTSETWAADNDRSILILDLMTGWFRDKLRKLAEIDGADTEVRIVLSCLEDITKTRNAMETTANKQLLFEQMLFSLTR